MKLIYLTILVTLTAANMYAQEKKSMYNNVLADSLQADENGMKKYMLVILKTGEAKIDDKQVRDSLFKGHFANMNRMSKLGKLILAGPLERNDQTFRGIFILNVTTKEEARELINVDPTVQSNIFEPLYFDWYGSAALPMYLKYHDMVTKETK